MVAEPTRWIPKLEREKLKKRACSDCYRELRRLVGPHTSAALSELKVLDHGACSWLSSWEVLWTDCLAPVW